jgi:pilus assembly protein CpaB
MPLRIIVIGLFLMTAAALGMIAYQVSLPHPQTAVQPLAALPPPPAPPKLALVAARPLPAGTLTRDEDFTARPVPPEGLPADAIMDGPDAKAGIRGALVRHYIDAGTPVTTADVLRPRDRGFLAAVLEPGMRAISIGVDMVSGVAGLIWPGDRVDVLLTQELDASLASLGRRVFSETVVSDVRVLAIDQQITQGAAPGDGAAGHLARTVTLQVSTDQAERIAVAQRLGHFSLAVRSIEEALPIPDKPPQTVFGNDVSPALAETVTPVGTRLRLILGDKRDEVTFR